MQPSGKGSSGTANTDTGSRERTMARARTDAKIRFFIALISSFYQQHSISVGAQARYPVHIPSPSFIQNMYFVCKFRCILASTLACSAPVEMR